MSLHITITAVSPAPAPDQPSHLLPGAGSDRAAFRVSAGEPPDRDVLGSLIEDAVVDACLTDYDQAKGEGYFVVVDGDAPALGTVIDLETGETTDPAGSEAIGVDSATEAYPTLTLEAFYDELVWHDWYFAYSDDGSEYRRGQQAAARLDAIAKLSGQDHAALYDAFKRHYFSGKPWGTAQWDKPKRPVNGVLVLPDAPVMRASPVTTLAPSSASASLGPHAEVSEMAERTDQSFDVPNGVDSPAMAPPPRATAVGSADTEPLIAAAQAWRKAHERLEKLEYAALCESVSVRVLRWLRGDRAHADALAQARDQKARCEDGLAFAVACLTTTRHLDSVLVAHRYGITAQGSIPCER
ncbi:hypothetical protein [Burkholderia glumae]|uniref:hypothetical protein n=1 Tax=Burkholderia glumae TaxID=337 RepID=UPI002150B61D|nr:hypothetical protein [Burkholderia glumae]